jgi:hypothetical protein
MFRSLARTLTVVVTLGIVPVAEALPITPSTPGWTTDITQNLSSDALWWSAFGFDSALPDTRPDVLYKSNVGAGETGPYATVYSTTYSNTPLEPSDAVISWDGGFYMDCSVCYLLVKDGNNNPAQYLFDISSWNGTENIVLTGFWPANGAISNVQILGTATRVPEPSTIALLGCGLAVVYLRRRRAAV